MTSSQLVKHAVHRGITAIAITDHDTVEGIEEAIEEGTKKSVEIVPGIEISVDFKKELHILGYYIDIYSEPFNNVLQELKEFRRERNPMIIKKLNEIGIDVQIRDVEKGHYGGVLGRPHIAAALLKKGYVSNIKEAFEKYLAQGKPAFVRKQRLTPKEGIELIKSAGGLAVIAHPVYIERSGVDLEDLIIELEGYGLDGIEVYYSEHSNNLVDKYLKLAQKYNLIPTGGSDFHGINKPDIELGIGHGDLKITYDILEVLKSRRG
jgi:predicted metal-dependent phosphoesterase TrpH